ncbi:hypothetical protein VTI28DRAFT_3214 [Corynascus sepedonium]
MSKFGELMGKSLTEASEISSHRARCHPRVLYVDVAEAGALVLVGGLGGADCILQVECMLLPYATDTPHVLLWLGQQRSRLGRQLSLRCIIQFLIASPNFLLATVTPATS